MKKGCKKLAGFLAALLCVIPSTGLYAKNALKFKVKNAEGYSITYEVKEGTNGLVSVTDAKVKKRSTLRIPETVEYKGQTYIVVEIADQAFATNKNQGLPFRAVELPSTIRRIGKYAFQWCNSLESINLPEGLLIIDVLAFAYTYNLKQLSIPSSVIYIGDMAFQNWKPFNINYPKKCELENLPFIVTPDNSEQYGLNQESVTQYYATHPAPIPTVDVESDEIQRFIATWNEASDAKWYKQAKRAQIIGAVALGLLATAEVALPAVTGTSPTVTSSVALPYSGDPISPSYMASVQASANQSMTNIQRNMQLNSQQILQQSIQVQNRMSSALQDVGIWAINFEKNNGRAPTENEKEQWIITNYPDIYMQYMSTKVGLYEKNIQGSDNKTYSDRNLGSENGVDYRKWYKDTEDNLAGLHRSFSAGSSVSTDNNGNINDKKDGSTSGGTYLQVAETYRELQKELKRIREEAAQNGITITPSKWETAELNP